MDYTIGPPWRESPIHHGLIRSRLTNSLEHLFPAALDEMRAAFHDEFEHIHSGMSHIYICRVWLMLLLSDIWTTISTSSSISRIVCRTSNRLFVGLPLCKSSHTIPIAAFIVPNPGRNEEYTHLNLQFTDDVVTGAGMLMLPRPAWLKRYESIHAGVTRHIRSKQDSSHTGWLPYDDQYRLRHGFCHPSSKIEGDSPLLVTNGKIGQ